MSNSTTIQFSLSDDDLQHEEWRDVPGYEDVYQISNMGRVKRIGESQGSKLGRVLKPLVTTTGYLQVTLSIKSVVKNVKIHKLVALAFMGIRAPKMDVNHKNANKHDNRLENLEWCTRSENLQHASRMGLMTDRYVLVAKIIQTLS